MVGKLFDVFEKRDFELLSQYVWTLYQNHTAITDNRYQEHIGICVSDLTEEGHVAMFKSDFVDHLMKKIQKNIERFSGHTIIPKNHYIRIHTPESKGWPLEYHLDHCGNDINISMNLHADDINKEWPIYFADYDANVSENVTYNNQGVVYEGKYPHWRNAFPGGTYIQLFMHYTRADNPASEWCTDRANEWRAHGTPNTYADYDKSYDVYLKLKENIDAVSDQFDKS